MNRKLDKLLWLFILGFVAIELLFLLQFHPRSVTRVVTNHLPAFNIWWSLVLFQAGFWGYSSCIVLQWWGELRKEGYRLVSDLVIRRVILLGVVVGSTAFPLPFGIDFHLPPEYAFVGLWGLSALGFVAAAGAVEGIWLTEAVLLTGSKSAGSNVAHYLHLRDCLDRFLLVAGIILGMGTISVGTLGYFISALGFPKDFPNEYVILFGGLYSTLLALDYAPAYLAFQRKGADIRNALLEKSEPELHGADLRSVKEWAAQRAQLDNILRLRFRDWASLGPGLSILAPLVISVVTHLLSGK